MILGKGIHIDDDLTRAEREVQEKVRRMLKEEREKGNNTKIGYMKLQVNDRWIKWDELRQRFEEDRRGRREQEKEEEKGAKICIWNIAGVLNKDKETWEYLCKFDIVGLIETWLERDKWEKIKNKLPRKFNWKCTFAERENKMKDC